MSSSLPSPPLPDKDSPLKSNPQAEFDRYKRACAAEGVDTPTKSFLLEKNKAINAMLKRTWTEEELQQKLERSGVLEQRIAPILRRDIRDRRAGAIARADEATIAQCDKELAELDGPKGKATVEEPRPEPAKPGRTQSEILEEVNRRNRRINAISVRKAQLEERAVRMRGLRKVGMPDENNKEKKKKKREQQRQEGDGASAVNGDDGETAPPCPLPAADMERLLTPIPDYNVAGYKMICSDVIDYSPVFAAIDWGIDNDIEV